MSNNRIKCTSIVHCQTPTGGSNYQVDHVGALGDCANSFREWCEQHKALWGKLLNEKTGETLANYTAEEGMVMRRQKTDKKIVIDANRLARQFYAMHGCVVPDGYKFYSAKHPMELGCWNMSVAAYEHIEGTDVLEALEEIGETVA